MKGISVRIDVNKDTKRPPEQNKRERDIKQHSCVVHSYTFIYPIYFIYNISLPIPPSPELFIKHDLQSKVNEW